ncbi:MAG: class I tRNA ligase family protein, partial [Christensenellaceae bacterium]|nr:class I tRNA ligase family protein [Christensenellaceae bacterium]
KAGYDVTKEYYVNDHGNQIITLTNSLIYRYEEQFGAHKNEEHPAEFYPGDYLIDAAKTIAEKYGSQFLKGKTSLVAAEHTATFRSLAINMMLDLIRADLASLGIIFDVFSSEAALVNAGKVQDSFAVLDKLNLTRVGVLPRPMGYDGDEDAEYEEKEQLLFKSTLFGDASDRVIKKSDGTLTYFASDIAYHYDKFKRGFDLLIDVWGADHGGYVPRITSAVTEITEKGAELNVVLCQMVNLLKEGKPFKMSKRAGNFIMVSDIGELVPLDILKFYMLSRSPDSQISFDFDEVVNQSEDNLVYYIQYASARAVNVEKKYLEVFNAAPSYNTADYYQNASEQERALSREILRFPEIIVKAARTFGPQYVVEYLLKLSRTFHALYTGVGGVRVTFVDKDDRAMSDKRLTLIQAFRSTIASALTCLGITPANFLSR